MTDPDDRGDGAPPAGSGEAADAPRSSPPRAERHRQHARRMPLWQELTLLLGLAMVLAVVIKAFILQAFYIPSGSMNDTLVLDDRILVQKVSYWGEGAPSRGDVVVFADPGGWLQSSVAPQPETLVGRALELLGLLPAGGHLVKRVIGVGGDTVTCCDARDRMVVNGVPLDERSYLGPGEPSSLTEFTQVVPDGHLWVMGDNRSHSADSRAHLGHPGGGFVPAENVVGKVFSVVWPLDHAKLVTRPETFEAVPS